MHPRIRVVSLIGVISNTFMKYSYFWKGLTKNTVFTGVSDNCSYYFMKLGATKVKKTILFVAAVMEDGSAFAVRIAPYKGFSLINWIVLLRFKSWLMESNENMKITEFCGDDALWLCFSEPRQNKISWLSRRLHSLMIYKSNREVRSGVEEVRDIILSSY